MTTHWGSEWVTMGFNHVLESIYCFGRVMHDAFMCYQIYKCTLPILDMAPMVLMLILLHYHSEISKNDDEAQHL